jgi:hypothetical protein
MVATPFLYDSFIHYSTPVYPDAIQPGLAAPQSGKRVRAFASDSSRPINNRPQVTNLPHKAASRWPATCPTVSGECERHACVSLILHVRSATA